MKKFFSFFSLVTCFTFLFTTASNAQYAVRNDTDCDFDIRVVYAKSGLCTPVGSLNLTVLANTTQNFNVPNYPVNEAIQANGLSATFCPFAIGNGCNSSQSPFNAACVSPPTTDCNIYTAEWSTTPIGTVIRLYN